MWAVRQACAVAAVALALAACGGDDSAPREDEDAEPPASSSAENLEALGLFDDAIAQTPAEGVVPYDVNAVLYADESEKLRFMSVPAGETAAYDAMGFWDYPDGTTFVKTFFFYRDVRDPELGRRLLETRIIRRDKGTWTGRTYVWNDAQTEATRYKVGKTLQVECSTQAAKNARRTTAFRTTTNARPVIRRIITSSRSGRVLAS